MLPTSLQKYINTLLNEGGSPSALKVARSQLTQRYRSPQGQTVSGFSSSNEVLAYVASRMPATYAAVEAVLGQAPIEDITSVLDLGAGPGTAALAAALRWPQCSHFHLVEGDDVMKNISEQLLEHVPEIDYQKFSFEHANLLSLSLDTSYDLILLSYVLVELSTKDQLNLLKTAWANANKGIVIVMPGTPKGYQQLMIARDVLINQGAVIGAPCPHNDVCPLKEGDWCHFSARLPRSSLHRTMKDATLSYEDEKFSYIIALRDFVPPSYGRIIRKPMKRSGHVLMDLCTPDGVKRQTISKRDKPLYKDANSMEWGDVWRD